MTEEPHEVARGRAGRCGQAREGEAARAHRSLGHGGAGGPRPVGDGGLENVLALRGGRHLRAQERRAEVGAHAHRGGCHCQVGEKARNGVCEVSGRVKEAGEEARFIGSRGCVRAESMLRGWSRALKRPCGVVGHRADEARDAPDKWEAHRLIEGGNRVIQPRPHAIRSTRSHTCTRKTAVVRMAPLELTCRREARGAKLRSRRSACASASASSR